MNRSKTIFAAILMIVISLFPKLSIAQHLEVAGQAKVTVMNTDNAANPLVVIEKNKNKLYV